MIEFPKIIYAYELIGTNGIHCCDYKTTENDVKYIKYTDHLADKSEAVLAERKATKDRVVEILEELMSDKDYVPLTLMKAISKIEEEVK